MTAKIITSFLSPLLSDKEMDSSHFCDITPEQWNKIFSLSCPHGIAAVLYDAISTLPADVKPPKMLQIAWAVEAEKAEKSYKKKCGLIDRLSSAMTSEGMVFILLKGASTASYYPLPCHRYFGDIDFYVLQSGAMASDKADTIISNSFNIKTDTSHHHHNVYTLDGVLLENHFDFIETHSHKSSIELEKDLKKLSVPPTSKITLTGENEKQFEVFKAPANFNAVFLLRHLASHFAAAEIGLRHILDYGLFLKGEYGNIDFKIVSDILEKHHLSKFASIINTILTKYLSLPEKYTSGVFSDTKIAEKVFHEIIYPSFPIYGNAQQRNPIVSVTFRTRRFFASRWKHDLIYPENFYSTFLHSTWSHILKPKSLIK